MSWLKVFGGPKRGLYCYQPMNVLIKASVSRNTFQSEFKFQGSTLAQWKVQADTQSTFKEELAICLTSLHVSDTLSQHLA